MDQSKTLTPESFDQMACLRQRVEHGAHLLDRYGPLGWRKMVDPQTLNLYKGDLCVLGQIYGQYSEGRNTLMPQLGMGPAAQSADWLGAAVAHGFMSYYKDDLDILTKLWQEEVGRKGRLLTTTAVSEDVRPVICERVRRGMKLLDEHMPGWKDKLNVQQLDMSSSYACVLGQLYKSLLNGRQALKLSQWVDVVNNGFGVSMSDQYRGNELTTVWVEEIQKDQPAPV